MKRTKRTSGILFWILMIGPFTLLTLLIGLGVLVWLLLAPAAQAGPGFCALQGRMRFVESPGLADYRVRFVRSHAEADARIRFVEAAPSRAGEWTVDPDHYRFSVYEVDPSEPADFSAVVSEDGRSGCL